jgi:hypothetical protein
MITWYSSFSQCISTVNAILWKNSLNRVGRSLRARSNSSREGVGSGWYSGRQVRTSYEPLRSVELQACILMFRGSVSRTSDFVVLTIGVIVSELRATHFITIRIMGMPPRSS